MRPGKSRHEVQSSCQRTLSQIKGQQDCHKYRKTWGWLQKYFCLALLKCRERHCWCQEPQQPGITACRAGCSHLWIDLSLIICQNVQELNAGSAGKESRFFSQAWLSAAGLYLHAYWQCVTPASLQNWWTSGWILNRTVFMLGTYYDMWYVLCYEAKEIGQLGKKQLISG